MFWERNAHHLDSAFTNTSSWKITRILLSGILVIWLTRFIKLQSMCWIMSSSLWDFKYVVNFSLICKNIHKYKNILLCVSTCVFVCQFVEQTNTNIRVILNITDSGLLNSNFILKKCMNVIALDITILILKQKEI